MSDAPVLRLEEVRFGYGDITAVWQVSLEITAGAVCAVVGRNGAGKSTLCNGIGGLLQAQNGMIALNGADVTKMPPWERAGMGIALVQEGKRVFRDLTVDENLRIGLNAVPRRRRHTAAVEEVYSQFPVLSGRRKEVAGALSGGQQQMLAIAQALVTKPTVMVIDEPSSGLAPVMVEEILTIVAGLRDQGMAVMLVEQLELLSELADTVVALDQGRVLATGAVRDMDLDGLAESIYLGR